MSEITGLIGFCCGLTGVLRDDFTRGRHLFRGVGGGRGRGSGAIDIVGHVGNTVRSVVGQLIHTLGHLHNHADNLLDIGPSRDLEFVYQELEDLPMIEGDSQRIYHTLWSIISNAIKYTPDGGAITVSGHYIEDEGMVHVSIQDTGVGIPPENLDLIFNDFFTTREGGTGLGLSNVRRLAADCGASIRVASAPGQGSTFTLFFPLPQPPERKP